MWHAGLDLSRKRLDVHVLDDAGATVAVTAVSPDAESLRRLAADFVQRAGCIRAAIESMTGARFVHDQLELAGWDVEIADAQKTRGLAPLACKTDHIDAFVLAELSRRDLVPAIWLPTPAVRAERERARFRLHLVRHRTALKNRIHATLMTFGKPNAFSDLFGMAGRKHLAALKVPEPWLGDLTAALSLVDTVQEQIEGCERELRRLGADHRYVPLLMTAPGIGYVLGYTIASEIGDITRFASPAKLCGYTGLCPRVYQSGNATIVDPSPRTAPSTCAGPSSRPRRTPASIRCTPTATNERRNASADSAGQRWLRSTWRDDSRTQSGSCCIGRSHLLGRRRARFWPRRGPSLEMRRRARSHSTWSSGKEAIER